MRLACVLMAAALLAACGGGGSDPAPVTATPAPTPPPTPPANNAPTISGTPQAQVIAGETYSFTPSASDPDGDTLTFSIANAPAWASFDEDTGALAGTPAETHIGTTVDVTISVSDGTDSASLAPFDLEVQRIPVGSATVSWDIPTTNADGSALSDLAGFIVAVPEAPHARCRHRQDGVGHRLLLRHRIGRIPAIGARERHQRELGRDR